MDTIARKIRRYKAVINIKQLTTGTNHQKLKKVQEIISNVEAYMGAKIHMYGKETYIMVEFNNKEAMDEACKITIEENSDFILQPLINRVDDEIKNRTMVIRDLPLNVDKSAIKRIMERTEKTVVTDIRTKVTGP